MEEEIETQEEEQVTEDTTETPAPETPTPNVDEIRNTYNQMFLEQQKEIRQLREAQNRPAPREENLEEDKTLLFDNPRRLLREEVSEQLKPLIEFQQSFQRQQMLDSFKQQMRGDALGRFKFMDKVGNYFDRAVGGLNQITPEAVVGAYNLAVGAFLTDGGNLYDEIERTDVPAPSKPNNTPMSTVPPHAKPSAPVKNAPPRTAKPVLTETEKKIARFNNMSDEDYVMWRDMPSDKIMEAK